MVLTSAIIPTLMFYAFVLDLSLTINDMRSTSFLLHPTFSFINIQYHISDKPHAKYQTSHMPKYLEHATSRTSYTFKIPHLKHPSCQISCTPSIITLEHPTSWTFHILNISHAKHPTSQTSWIPRIPLSLFPVHLFALTGKRKRCPGTLQTRD